MAVKASLYYPNRVRPVSKHLAHVSFWDIEMHRHLTVLGHPRPALRVPMLWNTSELQSGSHDLLQYFHTSASQSLTTLGHDPTALGQALMRIAFASNTPSAAAVFNSLLALSSLHRYGVQTHAFCLKIATIKSLAAAATATDLSAREVIQHAAAGMLLCSFEVHQASCTSSQWTWYISGVKEVLNAPCLKHLSRDSDLNALMDWVYYHDVMSRFTLRHWHGDVLEIPPKPAEMCAKEVYTPVRTAIGFPSRNAVQSTESSMLANMELLVEISDAVMTKPRESISGQQMDDFKGYIRILDWRIRNLPTHFDGKHSPIHELFLLATQIYLNRVTGDLLNHADNIEAALKRGFSLFSQLDCCERQYPLFVIGCEARTDEQRLTVLDLISRTEKRNSSRSMNHVKILVPALWAQDDLADKELNYWDKMSSIISSCTIIPSLV
ncbi:fungal-specific transcription factor domain-containing protein [Pyrenochaeta sp. MPI-SDFR-AT-0127]|nr:fungal-specific transcription factor domain-containing protein [Pyrenochaeta sp. MPI-SDFR-AT-0127]